MSGAAVEVLDLVKRYPRAPVNAVDSISFSVEHGEVFGLLGPNGAGKTTTVGVLTTRVRPTSGSAAVDGVDVVRQPTLARTRLAVVPQRSNLDRALSIRNNLIFHAAYHGVPASERTPRADALLEQFGLRKRAKAKPDFISEGQSQRIMIARALMHEPLVLFLDEPTTGLDPAARLFVWDRLRELKQRRVTLVLTTHDMQEAAELADRVAIMDHGQLLAVDTPQALVRSLPGAATLELTADTLDGGSPDDVYAALDRLPGVEAVEPVQGELQENGELAPELAGAEHAGAETRDDFRVRLYVSVDAPMLVAPAASTLAEHRLAITDVKLGSPSLEDVFIHLTGRALR
jgi:ABC-2 type transport system ATP-binding protein